MDHAAQVHAGATDGGSGATNVLTVRVGRVVSALGVTILVWGLLAGAGAGPATTGVAPADPFVQAAAIEFRRAERASRVSAPDAFVQPAAIEFRRLEHEARR